MKMDSASTCPGCKRHCPMGSPKCKYGVAYFKKAACAPEKTEKKRRWKREIAQDGVVWQLISVGRRMKKSLKKGEVTEGQLTAALSEAEKQALSDLLTLLSDKKIVPSGD